MILLDANRMTIREEAHRYLAEQLGLPDYYGRNLDALYDCLTDLEDTEIMIANHEEAMDTYFEQIAEVLREAQEDNAGLTVHYQAE